MAKYTQEQIQTLASEMRFARDDDQPFTLLTGAGCSKSAGIPLAGELVAEINDTQKYALYLNLLSEDEKKDYTKCMAKLPKARRKELLTPYLDNAKINWSHIAIASLIKAGYIQRVLTFNFDNVLTKACGLCGEYPAIYDYAASSASASINHLVTPSIIHLHGQGFGLTMINSEEETRQHAENLRPLIKKIMDESPIIAIGYSGEADAVFPALAELYNGEHSLHWCDYGEEPKPHISNFLNKHPHHIKHYAETDGDRFLIQLAQALGCFPPAIFDDTITHLREEIRDVAAYPLAENSEYDVLKQMHQTLNTFEQTATKDTLNVIGEREAQSLLLKGRYDEIVERRNKGDKIPESILAEAYFHQAYQFSEQADKEKDPALYEQTLEKYAQVLAIKPDSHEALYNWGNALGDLAQLNNDPALYEQAIEKYAQALAIKPDSHEALNNWGNALGDLAQLNNDPTLNEQAIQKYAQALAIKPDYTDALNNWGAALVDLAQLNNDPALYEQAVEKYAQVLAIKPDSHEALNNWGIALVDLARLHDDPARYEQAVEKYAQALAIKPDYPDALNNWGSTLRKLAQLNDDPARYEQAIEKYRQALAIEPDDHSVLDNLSGALLHLWKQTHNNVLLDQADDVIGKALILKPGDAYNAACLAALRGNDPLCQQHLKTCLTAGTLPDKAHLNTDEDLDGVRNSSWFKQFMAPLPDAEG